MENATQTEQAPEMTPIAAAASPKSSITIPLDRESALVGFCALLLIALAFETYQLVRIRQVIASGPVAAASAAPTTSAPAGLPQMSGGC